MPSKSRPIKKLGRNPRGQTLYFAFRLDGQVHVEERVHERQHPLSVDMGLNQLDMLVRKAVSYLKKKAGKPAVQKRSPKPRLDRRRRSAREPSLEGQSEQRRRPPQPAR
jgi:hypothetical protein